MSFAALHLPEGNWDKCTVFMVLRAFHYLYDFHGIREVYLNIASVPENAAKVWETSLGRKKKGIRLLCNMPCAGLPLFAEPDFPLFIDGKQRVDLMIPEIPGLTDFHVHTPLAFCRENMTVPETMEMARCNRIAKVNFSEHSGQLFCSADTYWNNRFRWQTRKPEEDRSWKYKNISKNLAGAGRVFGLELDVDEDAFVSDFQSEYFTGYRLGAIHFLGKKLTYAERKADFMRRFNALLANGMDIFAHPFRVFRKAGEPIPTDLFEEIAEKLVRADVAAEINFHTNAPQPEFVELVLKKGGKIAFGSDSHNLYEVGYFKPHYDFCKELGVAGKLDEILLKG